MTASKTIDMTGAAPFYTMNLIHLAMFSVLPGIYVFLSLLCTLLLGNPKINSVQPLAIDSDSTQRQGRGRRRRAVITGANTGIGFASARQLVLEHNVDVVLACRSRDRANQAVAKINSEAAQSEVVAARASFLHPCDLSNLESVRQFARVFLEKYETLDILICNAGVNSSAEGRTADDFELIFQCNVLGHFLLIQLLMDLFPESGEGRIVMLSSVAHHFVDSTSALDETYWKQLAKLDRSMSGSSAILPAYWTRLVNDNLYSYIPSKLATLLMAVELNRRFGEQNKSRRVRAFAVNPGAVASDIWRGFPSIVQLVIQQVFLTTTQGCATTIAAAVGEHDKDVLYLQPYWMPQEASRTAPFPVLEMMGPFMGYNVTLPRLPLDGGVFAAQSLWKACGELTATCREK